MPHKSRCPKCDHEYECPHEDEDNAEDEAIDERDDDESGARFGSEDRYGRGKRHMDHDDDGGKPSKLRRLALLILSGRRGRGRGVRGEGGTLPPFRREYAPSPQARMAEPRRLERRV